MKNWKTPEVKRLITALAMLDGEKEIAAFLRDICTQTELNDMAKRLTAALLLEEGKPIRQISEETGLSTTTISRVSQWKRHGEGGYDIVLARLSGQA